MLSADAFRGFYGGATAPAMQTPRCVSDHDMMQSQASQRPHKINCTDKSVSSCRPAFDGGCGYMGFP